MTRISFLHGAAERIPAAARWLRDAWQRREPVVVFVPDESAATQLDRILWTQPALSFVPHCRADAPLAGETPILLAATLDGAPHDGCLLNLADALPPGFARFEHLVEIVSVDDRDRLPARERYKFYRDRGYPLTSTDISGAPV